MRKHILNNLLALLATLVIGLLFILPRMAKGADVPDEVTASRAELASTKAELNKIKYANIPAIEAQIKPALDDWKEAYGDTQTTQLYFNHKAAMVEIEQCKAAIRLIATTINSIADPNDPNSLAARVETLEKWVIPEPISLACNNGFDEVCLLSPFDCLIHKAIKPDDPNEVKK